ncbi:unnamed protein product [Camellia sinensis]
MDSEPVRKLGFEIMGFNYAVSFIEKRCMENKNILWQDVAFYFGCVLYGVFAFLL